MKKISYIKFALSFLLVSTALTGCKPDSVSNDKSNSASSNAGITRPSQDSQKIDKALNEFLDEQNKFLGRLNNAINDEESRQKLTSANLDEKRKVFTTEVENFRKEQLPKVNQKETVEKALSEIETTLTEISQKVIDPLKGGFTEASIENLQRKLEFFSSQNISEQFYGNYGQQTYDAVNDFLQTKQNILKQQLQIIKSNVNSNAKPRNLQELSDRVAQLEKEKTMAMGIAILALLASGVSLLRRPKEIDRRSPKISGSRNSRNRSDRKSILSIFNIPIFGQKQNKQSDTRKVDTTDIQVDAPNDSRIDTQTYNHFYNEIYNEIYNELEQKFSKKIQSIESKVRDLENRPQKTTESRSGNYQPPQIEEEREQARIVPWSSSPEPVSTPPARSIPTFSNPQWVDTYNRQSHSLSLTEVSPTEESLNNRRLGSSQPIILETKRRGQYGIYIDGNEHYLVPSQHFRINQHNYKTVEALFECRNYTPDSSGNFRLLKPTVVYPITGGKSWRLYEPGILQF